MIPTLLAQRVTDPPPLSPETVEAVSEMGYQAVIGPYMGIFFIAFFVALVMTPIMRLLATRNGIVDWPDLHRKNHIEPVAYLGGGRHLRGLVRRGVPVLRHHAARPRNRADDQLPLEHHPRRGRDRHHRPLR